MDNIDNQKNQLEDLPCKENGGSLESARKATPVAKKKQQRRSFAPPNFQFTAPSGLHSFESLSKDFKFQPMSPASTESFFKGVTDFPTPENRRQLITKANFKARNDADENNNPIPMSEDYDSKTQESSSANEEDSESSCEKTDDEGIKDVEYKDPQLNSIHFRNLISLETEKLNILCEKWDREMESSGKDLSEEGNST
jgi:hypothetical protein